MPVVLNTISALTSILFGIGAMYCLLDFTFGKVRVLNSKFEWNKLQIKDFVFLLISIILQYMLALTPIKPY